MVEDTIAKVERQIRERQAREAAEAERLKQAMAAKATMTYGPEIGQAICDAVAEGAVLKELCRCEGFPTHKLLRQWIAERPGFAAALKEAERVRLFAWEDEMLITARDSSRDRIVKDDGKLTPDSTAVARAKLLCDSLARLLKAHYPTVWGDALTVKQPEPVDLTTDLAKLPLETLEAMRDNARKLEQDQEVRELLAQKRALTELNSERKARGDPPLSLAKFLIQ